VSSVPHRGLTYLGMDVHKDSISIGILAPEDDVPEVEKIFHDEASVRRFVTRFVDPRQLVVCYEAGPTGYGLHRLLVSMGVSCQVIAPSLIPRSAADRVKTDLLTELPRLVA
jgi:transposase